jgi:hypothetical protein
MAKRAIAALRLIIWSPIQRANVHQCRLFLPAENFPTSGANLLQAPALVEETPRTAATHQVKPRTHQNERGAPAPLENHRFALACKRRRAMCAQIFCFSRLGRMCATFSRHAFISASISSIVCADRGVFMR